VVDEESRPGRITRSRTNKSARPEQQPRFLRKDQGKNDQAAAMTSNVLELLETTPVSDAFSKGPTPAMNSLEPNNNDDDPFVPTEKGLVTMSLPAATALPDEEPVMLVPVLQRPKQDDCHDTAKMDISSSTVETATTTSSTATNITKFGNHPTSKKRLRDKQGGNLWSSLQAPALKKKKKTMAPTNSKSKTR
jgi:hypothetical protein